MFWLSKDFLLKDSASFRLCVYYTESAFMKFYIITTLFMLGVLRFMEVSSFWTLKSTNTPGIWVLINAAAAAAQMWFNCTLSYFLHSGFHRLYHPMVAPGKRSEVLKRKIVACILQSNKEYLSKSSLTSFRDSLSCWFSTAHPEITWKCGVFLIQIYCKD